MSTNICARRIHGITHLVAKQVYLPSQELHDKHLSQIVKRRVGEYVVQIQCTTLAVWGKIANLLAVFKLALATGRQVDGVVLAGPGHIVFVALHAHRRLVMFAV